MGFNKGVKKASQRGVGNKRITSDTTVRNPNSPKRVKNGRR